MSDSESKFTDGIQRYFLEKKIKCFYCRKVGHYFRDCKEKEISCFLCKEDHEPTRCPLSLICFHCYKRGHTKADCPNKSNKKYCSKCQTNSHATMECEKIWRKYKTSRNETSKIKKYCYLCAESGHFGDDCSTNNFRFRHSAFSQDVLESFLDQSISKNKEKSNHSPKKYPKKYHSDSGKKYNGHVKGSGENTRFQSRSKGTTESKQESSKRKKGKGDYKGRNDSFYDRLLKSTSPRIRKR